MYSDYWLSSAAIACALVLGLVALAFSLAGYVIGSWLTMLIFRKAGIESWKAWVPFYSQWVFLELGGQSGWMILLTLIPGASIVALIFIYIAAFHVGAAFSKSSAGWVVLYVFLPVVWLAVVAFDSSRWNPALMSVRPQYGANVPWPAAPPAEPPVAFL